MRKIFLIILAALSLSLMSCGSKNHIDYVKETLEEKGYYVKKNDVSSVESINKDINKIIEEQCESENLKKFTVKLDSFQIYEDHDSVIVSGENIYIYKFENAKQAKNYFNLVKITLKVTWDKFYICLDGEYLYLTTLESIVNILPDIEFTTVVSNKK